MSIKDGIIEFGKKKDNGKISGRVNSDITRDTTKTSDLNPINSIFGKKKTFRNDGIDTDIPNYTTTVVEEKWLMTIRRYPSGQSYPAGKMMLLGRKPYERRQKKKQPPKTTEFVSEDDLNEVSVL